VARCVGGRTIEDVQHSRDGVTACCARLARPVLNKSEGAARVYSMGYSEWLTRQAAWACCRDGVLSCFVCLACGGAFEFQYQLYFNNIIYIISISYCYYNYKMLRARERCDEQSCVL